METECRITNLSLSTGHIDGIFVDILAVSEDGKTTVDIVVPIEEVHKYPINSVVTVSINNALKINDDKRYIGKDNVYVADDSFPYLKWSHAEKTIEEKF